MRVLGRIHAHRAEFDPASNAFTDAMKLCQEWDSRIVEGRVLLDWAALEATQGSKEAASEMLDRSLEIFEIAGAKFWVDRARTSLDEIALEQVTKDR